MKKYFQRYKMVMILVSIVLLGMIIYLNQKKENDKPPESFNLTAVEQKEKKENENEVKEKHSSIFVDVKGQVVNPGIYKATEGERIQDIINRSGGFQKNADINQVNLAQKIHDEMVIYVPKVGENTELVSTETSEETSSPNQEIKININKANSEELQTISGIGPSKANAIIEYRTQKGLFKQVEDIKNISGIGDKTFEKLKNSITVD